MELGGADCVVLRSLQATAGQSPAALSRQTVKRYARLLPTAGESRPIHGIAVRWAVLALTVFALHIQTSLRQWNPRSGECTVQIQVSDTMLYVCARACQLRQRHLDCRGIRFIRGL